MKKFILTILIIILAFSVNVSLTADDWQSPTGHTEGDWGNEANTYDEDTGTSATISVSAYSWSEDLELTIDALYCDKVRFWAYYSGTYINSIDLDVYYDGSYHDVYEGTYADREWIEKSLGSTYSVTKVLIKFYNDYSSSKTAYIYEFDFNQTEEEEENAIWFGMNF